MRPVLRPAALVLTCLGAVAMMAGCAASGNPTSGREGITMMKSIPDKVISRLIAKGDFEKAAKAADSLAASKVPGDRELGHYWKAVVWLYCGDVDSALVLLEAKEAKWTGNMRKVHATILLGLARESVQARSTGSARVDDPTFKSSPGRALQDRLEVLQKENSELRVEHTRLESEKEKYKKLLKDLETIR